MKTLMTMLIALATTGAIANNKPMTDTFKVDANTTKVKWIADKKIGAGHNGFVAVKDGSLTVQGDIITAGEISVDMNTISVADIPVMDKTAKDYDKDKDYNSMLVGHLKAPDFFDVAKYPNAKLVIKGSEKTKKGLKIKGDLTFIGQTHPVEFVAVVSKKDKTLTAKSDVVLDRTVWGLKYNSENWIKQLAGDKIIKDNFTLAVEISATK
jgi:polyisoprenoid-binding protein YceI